MSDEQKMRSWKWRKNYYENIWSGKYEMKSDGPRIYAVSDILSNFTFTDSLWLAWHWCKMSKCMGLHVDTTAAQYNIVLFYCLSFWIESLKLYMLLRLRKGLPSLPCHCNDKLSLWNTVISSQLCSKYGLTRYTIRPIGCVRLGCVELTGSPSEILHFTHACISVILTKRLESSVAT